MVLDEMSCTRTHTWMPARVPSFKLLMSLRLRLANTSVLQDIKRKSILRYRKDKSMLQDEDKSMLQDNADKSMLFYITNRSKAILLLWFLFYVLVLNFCAVFTLCAFSFFS